MPKNKKESGSLFVAASANEIEIIKKSPYYFIFPRAIKTALRGYHIDDFSTIITVYFAICEAPDWFWKLLRQHEVLKTSLRLHCCKILFQKGYFNHESGLSEEQRRCFLLVHHHPNLADMKAILDALQKRPDITSINYPLELLLVLLQRRAPIKLANSSLTILSYQHITPKVKEIFLKGLAHAKNRRSVMALFQTENLQTIFPDYFFEQSVMALCRSNHPEYFMGVISMISSMLFKQPYENFDNTYGKMIEHAEQPYLYLLIERMIESDWLNASNVLIRLEMLLSARISLEELFKAYYCLDQIGLRTLPNLMRASRCFDLVRVRESMSVLHSFKLNHDLLQYFFDKLINENFLTQNRQSFLLNLKKMQGKLWPEVTDYENVFELILNGVDNEEETKQEREGTRSSPIPEPATFFFGIH